MKEPARFAPPRRPKVSRLPTRLELRTRRSRRPEEEEEEEPGRRRPMFWRWVGLVALLHVLLIALFAHWNFSSPPPRPPEEFISLLPAGDIVKGKPGPQEAPKIGAATPAPSKPAQSAPPPPAPKPPTPQPVVHHDTPKPEPKPEVKPEPKPEPKPDLVQNKTAPDETPAVEPPPKPAPPKPKVKVDLHEVDRTAADTKPKPHPAKPNETTTSDDKVKPYRQAKSSPENNGLSKEQIAAKLGEKLTQAGVDKAEKSGPSGSANSRPNDFSDFYAGVRDQVLNHWMCPNNASERTISAVVSIFVLKDGTVPAEQVSLTRSSGDSAFDESALDAARSLGHLYQPLPDGCPPTIPITFKPQHE